MKTCINIFRCNSGEETDIVNGAAADTDARDITEEEQETEDMIVDDALFPTLPMVPIRCTQKGCRKYGEKFKSTALLTRHEG